MDVTSGLPLAETTVDAPKSSTSSCCNRVPLKLTLGNGGAPTTRNCHGKPSAVERFHSNPDILADICEYLASDDEWVDTTPPAELVTSRHHLAALARTCKAYLEPALDRLWRSLDTLYPLFRILPAFVITSSTHVIRGKITANDWARFDYYARRVKRFCYTRDPTYLDIAMHVYFRVAQLRSSSSPLLSCLRYLYCPDISQNDFLISGVCLFLSPSLQSLEFCKITSIEDKLTGTFLYTLFEDGAQLENITFKGAGLTQGTLDLILPFENLRSLELEGMGNVIEVEWLKQLSTKHRLEELALDFTGSNLAPDPNTSLQEIEAGGFKFPNLKSLMLTAPLSFTRAFIPKVGSQALETVVAVTATDTSHERTGFTGEVVDRWSTSLRSFALVHTVSANATTTDANGNPIPTGLPTGDFDFASLARLLPCQALEEFRLEGYTMDMTDENVEMLASAWPNLTKLLLPYLSADRVRPAWRAFEALRVGCRRLKGLRMPVDIAGIPPFVAPPRQAFATPIVRSDTITSELVFASATSSSSSSSQSSPSASPLLPPSDPIPITNGLPPLPLSAPPSPVADEESAQLVPSSPSLVAPPLEPQPSPSPVNGIHIHSNAPLGHEVPLTNGSHSPSSSRSPSPSSSSSTSSVTHPRVLEPGYPHYSPSHTYPHPLSRLAVSTSDDLETHEERVGDAKDLINFARYLDHYFPNLRTVLAFDGNNADEPRWAHVNDLVASYKALRREIAMSSL